MELASQRPGSILKVCYAPTKYPYFHRTCVLGVSYSFSETVGYRKSSIRSRPLIQVYSIRGQAIGGSLQALDIGKSLNPSKLPYLDQPGMATDFNNSRGFVNFRKNQSIWSS